MSGLVALIAGFLTGETVASFKRMRDTAVTYAIAALLILCGLGFLVGAAFVWISRRIGTIETSLAFAGVLLLVAVLLIVINRVSTAAELRKAQLRRDTEVKTIATTATVAAIPALMSSRIGIVIPLTLAAGGYGIYKMVTSGTRPSDLIRFAGRYRRDDARRARRRKR